MNPALSGGTHYLEHKQNARENLQPAFHLTFIWELTQHITLQLIKPTCFRWSALTPIFQGAEIRSTVTEECLLNKNWCITSWKAGWRWAFFCLREQILTFTLHNSIWFTSYEFFQIEMALPWLPSQSLSSSLDPSCILVVFWCWGTLNDFWFIFRPPPFIFLSVLNCNSACSDVFSTAFSLGLQQVEGDKTVLQSKSLYVWCTFELLSSFAN